MLVLAFSIFREEKLYMKELLNIIIGMCMGGFFTTIFMCLLQINRMNELINEKIDEEEEDEKKTNKKANMVK